MTYNADSFQYNLNGELESKKNNVSNQVTSFTYNSFGQITSVKLGSTSYEYEIDGYGRRIQNNVNGTLQSSYIYQDQIRVAGVVGPDGKVLQRYIYGAKFHVPDYMVIKGEMYRIITDYLGSVRLIVRVKDGSVAQEMLHDEFGKVTKNTAPGFQPFGFAGGLHDPDTGLTRFGARDYDPTIGRWLTKDPSGFNGGDTNLYAYCNNNPVSCIDPTGLWGITIGIGIGGYLGGGADAAGGFYFGSQNGQVFAGLYGFGATGFGGGAGIGLQGTFYPDANSITGSSLNYNGNIGFLSGSVVTNPNNGAITGYGGSIGIGSPRGGSITIGNTGAIGIIGRGDGSPVKPTTNVCQ